MVIFKDFFKVPPQPYSVERGNFEKRRLSALIIQLADFWLGPISYIWNDLLFYFVTYLKCRLFFGIVVLTLSKNTIHKCKFFYSKHWLLMYFFQKRATDQLFFSCQNSNLTNYTLIFRNCCNNHTFHEFLWVKSFTSLKEDLYG